MDSYSVDGIRFWHRVPAWDGSWGKLLNKTKMGKKQKGSHRNKL